MNPCALPIRWLCGLVLSFFLSGLSAAQPTALWLHRHGLQPWELALDHDADGFASGAEFDLGTDPRDPESRPLRILQRPDFVSVFFANTPGVDYSLEESPDLDRWVSVNDLPAPDGAPAELRYSLEQDMGFFRVVGLGLPDTDGDGLLDFEEITVVASNPNDADTDGDGWSDGEEVLVRGTDPLHAPSSGVGTLRGRVVLDEDRDPATHAHPGLAGWRVFLDLDANGEPGVFEPVATTAADGSYVFEFLEPGVYRVEVLRQPTWVQIFPSPSPVTTPDGYPDRLVAYLDSGLGPVPGPYGKNLDSLPGVRILTGLAPEAVDPAVILGALPAPPLSAPVGAYSHVDFLSLPQDAELTLAFDGEEVLDGPGDDLAIITEGRGGEQAEVYLGSTAEDLTLVGVFSEAPSILIDLADYPGPRPVRYLKLKALDLLGSFPGFDLLGVEALNFQAINRDHYEVVLEAGETVEDLDFGLAGVDHPPRVFLALERLDLQAGDTVPVKVVSSDDRGVTSVTLRANGTPMEVDGSGEAQIAVLNGGLLELTATVVDTGGQTAETLLVLVARNADGSLPDLAGLGLSGGGVAGGPAIRVFSPAVGEILTQPAPVVASISGPAEPVAWKLEYALTDQVNPEALDFDDPDYVLLAEGSGPIVNGVLGWLPADTLASGAYLLRLSASDLQGTTAYFGFVVGVKVHPLDIRPEIVLTHPDNETTLTYLTALTGSIRTRQSLREWSVEVAPLSAVDLQNLNAPGTAWRRIAGGTEAVEEGTLATFDPTVLPNDSYVIRVSAWNRNGLGWTEPRVVHVSGAAKPGHFALEFVDLELSLAGIPLQVRRSYDSLRADRVGDFGHGWSLGLQDADVRETVPRTGTGFRSTPFRVGTRVYLNAPDGQRVGFTFRPELAQISFLGSAWRAVFVADPGTSYDLSVPQGDSAFLTLRPGTGEAFLFFVEQPWNPDEYILTDRAGTRYTYSDGEGLLEIEDSNGNTLTFSATAIQHSGGLSVALQRDTAGRITSITDPEGRQWTYQYDAAGDLVRLVYPGNLQAAFGYSSRHPHFLESIDDPVGQPALSIEYDDEGRVAATVDAMGNRSEQSWDPGSFTGTLTDARGNVTRLTYDDRGNVVREEDPLGGVTLRTYGDPRYPDRETEVTDPNGNTVTYAYDERGNLLQIERPARRSGVTYSYDERGRMIRAVFGLIVTEEFTYDAAGNLTHFADGLRSQQRSYTTDGRLASVLDGTGGLTRFSYEGASRWPSLITAPDGATREFAYNARGQIVRFTDRLGAVWHYEYDDLGRLVTERDPVGAETTTTYDPVFALLPRTHTDRVGRITRYTYDLLGRLVEMSRPGMAATRYEYDANGNRTAVVDPLGQRTEFAYDALNRRVSETDAAGGPRRYFYDPAGNLVEAVDANGRRRTFTYDTLNRRVEERWHDPADNAVLRTIRFEYDRLDRMTRAEDPDATLAFALVGSRSARHLTTRTTYPGRPEGLLLYAYDDAGRRIQWGGSSMDNAQVRLTRDLAGRVAILTADRSPVGRARLELRRNTRGDAVDLRRFNDASGAIPAGRTLFPQIDPRGWPTRIEHLDSAGQPIPDAALSFGRDNEGTLTHLLAGGRTQTFAYDAQGQLTEVRRDGVLTESYAYDLAGNRLASHRHASYVTGAGNRLLQAGPWAMDYDREGNLTVKSNTVTGEVLRYAWDHRNRLTEVARSRAGAPAGIAVTEYRYDPLDRRIAVVRNGETQWTYFNGLNPVADYVDADLVPTCLYLYGEGADELFALWPRDEDPRWTRTDHIGSIRQIVGTNAVVLASHEYDAFGNTLTVTGPQPEAAGRFGFTAREWDSETDLYYYRARHYDPDLGRFLSPDPLGFDAGDAHLYRYVANNPVNAVDPTGRLGLLEFIIVNEALLSGIILPSVDELATIGCRSALNYVEIAETLEWWDTDYDYDAWWECDQ